MSAFDPLQTLALRLMYAREARMYRRFDLVPADVGVWLVPIIWLHMAAFIVELSGLYYFDWGKVAFFYPLVYLACVICSPRLSKKI